MNKYFVSIPYTYPQYGTLTGYVYAEDEETAVDAAYDTFNVINSDYEDDDSGDTDFHYDDMQVSLDEEDVVAPAPRAQEQSSGPFSPYQTVPIYYLAETNLL